MMKRRSLVLVAISLSMATGTAHAMQGTYDAYGYHPPVRSAPTATAVIPGAPKFKVRTPGRSAGQPAKKRTKTAVAAPSVGATSGPAKVNVATGYGAGRIVIDQSSKKLYYTLSDKQAYVYPVAVGKDGFKWTGTKTISREVDWPDWRPPAEMRARKPNLPEYVAGGPKNPLGAKALYLGNSLYRIHGTNDPKSIGTDASSGCIRMYNGDVVHLANMARVGTTVHVVSKLKAD